MPRASDGHRHGLRAMILVVASNGNIYATNPGTGDNDPKPDMAHQTGR